MSPEEYVDALYRVLLRRPADPSGMQSWTAALARSGDATSVLAGLLESEEYRSLHDPDCSSERSSALALTALSALGRHPRIVDVGAQSLGRDSHAYSPLMDLTPVDVIGFDPLADRLDERAAAEGQAGQAGTLTLLPYAIGDGSGHTLHINNDDASSSLYPLNGALNSLYNSLESLTTLRTVEIATHQLDDVLPSGPVDMLKLDVQGAELAVLEHAPETLASTAIVHCEVEFAPIYRGQPLFGDVHALLREQNFAFVDFVTECRYRYVDADGTDGERLLWADAVFTKESDDPSTLVSQALLMAAVYRKPNTAAHLLNRANGEPIPR